MKNVNKLILCMILVIIIFFIVGVYYYIEIIEEEEEEKKKTKKSIDDYIPNINWSKIVKSSDDDKNTCQLYQFSGEMISDGNNIIGSVEASPTLTPVILDNMIGTVPGRCHYIDQIVAKQSTRTCTSTNGSEGICFGFDGTEYVVDESETFYDSVNCKIKLCPGTLSNIAFNYLSDIISNVSVDPVNYPTAYSDRYSTLPYNNAKCIYLDEDEYLSESCDISNQIQLFNVVRKDIIGSKVEAGDTGMLSQIFDRSNNSCITLKDDVITNGKCISFEWGLFNTILAGNRFGPQQIVYVNNLSSQILNELSELRARPIQFLDEIIKLDLHSLTLDDEGKLVLRPYSIINLPNSNPDFTSQSQYVNYSLFNEILFTNVFYPFS